MTSFTQSLFDHFLSNSIFAPPYRVRLWWYSKRRKKNKLNFYFNTTFQKCAGWEGLILSHCQYGLLIKVSTCDSVYVLAVSSSFVIRLSSHMYRKICFWLEKNMKYDTGESKMRQSIQEWTTKINPFQASIVFLYPLKTSEN